MFVDAIKSLPYPRPSRGAGSERERSEQSRDAIWTWISRSGFRFGSAALQKQGQPGHDVAAQFLDGADAGILLGDDAGVIVREDVEGLGSVHRVREQRRAALDVAQPEGHGRIELAAAAKPGLLNAEIGPRRGQQGVEAVALRRPRAVRGK